MILKLELEQLFPSSDDRARRKRIHLTKLFACYNDIIANAKALRATIQPKDATGDAASTAQFERRYFLRVICGHMHEALMGFEKCRDSGMIEEYRPLIKDGDKLYDLVNKATKNGRLRKFLEESRNRTFHYIFDETIIEGGPIVFGQDQTAASTRFLFVEDVIKTRINEEIGLKDDDELAVHEQATMLQTDLLRFVDRFLATIYEKHPDAFSRAE